MNKKHNLSVGHPPQVDHLNLQFTPKNTQQKKPKPLSDRNNIQPTTSTTSTPKTQRIMLIEKKKSYSEAIRQKNLNSTKVKKKSNVVIDLRDPPEEKVNTTHIYKENCPLSSGKKNSVSIRGRLENSLKKKSMFYGKRESISALNLQPIQKKQEFNNVTLNEILPTEQDEFDASMAVYHIENPKKKFSIESKIVNQTISNTKQQTKQNRIKVLQVQNGTFRKQLSSFRKQNSMLRKELQLNQKNLQQMEIKAKEALDQSTILQKSTIEKAEFFEDDNKEEILSQMQKQINELRTIKSNLQLKVYMAEKRIVEEVDFCKKKMAKEVSMWREKCAKLRAQNIKIKSIRDITFSMEISKDD